MAHSLAEYPSLTCPQCGASFTPEVWLIIDAAARPELLARVADGSIHNFVCPNGHAGGLDAPLLLYRPGQSPPLVFSPARESTADQDERMADELLQRLRASVEPDRHNKWPADEALGLARSLLVELMNGPDGATAEFPPLAWQIQEFITTDDWLKTYSFLSAHPEMLTDEATGLLLRLRDRAKATGNEADTRTYDMHLDVLRHSRQESIVAAIAAIVGMSTEQFEALAAEQTGSDRITHFYIQAQRANDAEERYQSGSDPAHLQEAITTWELILNDPELPNAPEHLQVEAFNNAGGVYLRRYWDNGKSEDLERAVALWRQSIDRIAADSPDRAFIFNNLGLGLSELYGRTGQLTDLNAAISAHEDAIALVSPEHPRRSMLYNNLGASLNDRYLREGDPVDLDAAIAAHELAASLTTPQTPNRPNVLNNLALGRREQFVRSGDLAFLDSAIEAWKEAVDCTPINSPSRASILNNLGSSLIDRFEYAGEASDLDLAIAHLREGVERTPPDSPNRVSFLNSLGVGLSSHYAQTGSLVDLDAAIAAHEEVVANALPNSPDRAMFLNNLGAALSDRYARTGNPADLDASIVAHQSAVALPALNSADRAMILNNIGASLSDRYDRTANLADLNAAVQFWREALEHTSQNRVDRAGRYSNLAAGLLARYNRLDDPDDLEAAIQNLEAAINLTPTEAPEWALFRNNLGNGLRHRYVLMANPDDLDGAIGAYRDAVAHASHDSPHWAMTLNNLGGGLHDRYTRTNDLVDLDAAVAAYSNALSRIPLDSPDRIMFLNNLANSLRDRHTSTAAPADLAAAVAAYEDALATLDRALLDSPVAFVLGQQSRWAGLYARTVTALLAAGRTTDALAVAEGSKSRLLANLMGRGELPAPPGIPAEPAARGRQAADRLRALDATELAERGRNEPTGDGHRRVADRAAVVADLRAVWDEMAAHGPAAADYVALRRGDRPTAAGLLRLAGALPAGTALLSLFDTGERTLLCLLRPGAAEPLVMAADIDRDTLLYDFLPNYEDEIQHGADHRALGRPLTHRWRELGRPLLGPLLPHLAGLNHLIIAPEGVYHQLPLHALRLSDAGDTLIDHCAVSYIPALGLLERLGRENRPDRLAAAANLSGLGSVVGRPSVVMGYTDADPTTDKGAEERDIFLGEARAVAGRLGVAPLLDQAATAAALDEAIQQPLRRLHLSCHGYFQPGDALASGVLLADGAGESAVYTARQFMARRLRADLVTLSACRTGISGSLGGDEMAGLSMGLLSAGARSLLLGLWSVASRTTAALMDDFYARLDGMDGAGGTKAETLRRVMLAFRAGDMMPPQAGFDPADPYYWAPFVLVGDWR